jgi:hypothetical protein
MHAGGWSCAQACTERQALDKAQLFAVLYVGSAYVTCDTCSLRFLRHQHSQLAQHKQVLLKQLCLC